MTLVVFFLVFNCLLIGAYFQYRRQHGRPGAPPLPRRLTGAQVRSFALRQVMLVLVFAVTYPNGRWTPESVGIHHPELWLDSILAGEIAFLALVLVHWLLLKIAGLLPTMRLVAARGNLYAWPRRRSHKIIAGIAIMVFNPFTEELMMRGVLIHQWALFIGSAAIPIAIGFVLNSLLHWYQGWRMQLWHAMYFVIAVGLLYSKWGLIAAITAHVFGDVMPFVGLRRNLLRARKERRAARAAQAA